MGTDLYVSGSIEFTPPLPAATVEALGVIFDRWRPGEPTMPEDYAHYLDFLSIEEDHQGGHYLTGNWDNPRLSGDEEAALRFVTEYLIPPGHVANGTLYCEADEYRWKFEITDRAVEEVAGDVVYADGEGLEILQGGKATVYVSVHAHGDSDQGLPVAAVYATLERARGALFDDVTDHIAIDDDGEPSDTVHADDEGEWVTLYFTDCLIRMFPARLF